MAIQVGYEQAGVYSASDDRKINAVSLAAIQVAGGAASPRYGVMPGIPGPGLYGDKTASEFGVEATAGDMTATMSPGRAVVPPNYRVNVDTTTQLSFAAVGANPRTDIVILRVYDVESGDATTEGKIEILKGADGGGTPAIPPRAIGLWQVAMPANTVNVGAGTWTDVRQFTAGAGGVIKQKAPLASQFAPGQLIYNPNIGAGRTLVRNRDTLVPLGLRMADDAKLNSMILMETTVLFTNGQGDCSYVYPIAFASPPVVMACLGDIPGGGYEVFCYVFQEYSNNTQFAVRLRNRDGSVPTAGGAYRINYCAIGISAT